ncbi:T9SS type A sorting domain-containing protein [Pontibacter sp. G13]|uniref:T9SS type A sorting domain-containing protein n=1 Tax=Pontibacter sp. G13 TaxID=3074898 RepID=UPI002889FF64|nr:T9SS type A sorting domain-containing protein [Pontibacter sp. G13]WNJ17724.1 T9SS type A sorting domain-containing protein [Pontibacter sp. G13]
MKKFFTLSIIALGIFTSQSLFAQSTEDGPIDDLLFTQHYYKWGSMPEELKVAVTPSIVTAPNPNTENVLKVWFAQLSEAAQLDIFDMNGRQVHAAEIGGSTQAEGIHVVQVASYTPGMYFVRMRTGLYEVIEKVIIK